MSGRLYAVVPAAGYGARMGSDVPKQYLALAGRTVLEHTVWRLAGHPEIVRIVVVVSPGDEHYAELAARLPNNVERADGGTERCHSVLNGLHALRGRADDDDWVMVHDAARPCVRRADLDRMLDELGDDPVGGILAVPVRDTLKRADSTRHAIATIDRSQLWQAQTPQMFRYGPLRDALVAALAAGHIVTDEAQAIEAWGFSPRLVPGHSDNLKITHPEDLPLALLILRAQEAGAGEKQQ